RSTDVERQSTAEVKGTTNLIMNDCGLSSERFAVLFNRTIRSGSERDLPAREADDGVVDAVDAREIRRFERRRVGDGRVDRADPADRSVEEAKEVPGDVGRDLGGVAAAQPFLVDSQHPAGT